MKHLGTLNESSIYHRSSDFSQVSDLELIREVYRRSQTDKVSSNTNNSVSLMGNNFNCNIVITHLPRYPEIQVDQESKGQKTKLKEI